MKVLFTTILLAAAAVVSAQEPSAEKPSAGAPSEDQPHGHSMSGAAMAAMAMAFPGSSMMSSKGHGDNNPVSYGSETHTSDDEDHSNPLEDDHGPDNEFEDFGHRPAPHSVSDIGASTTSAPIASKSDAAWANSSAPLSSSTASPWSSKLLVSDSLPVHATGTPQNFTSSGWFTNSSSVAAPTAMPKSTDAPSWANSSVPLNTSTAAPSWSKKLLVSDSLPPHVTGSPQNVTFSGWYTNTSSVAAPTTMPKGTGASSYIGTAPRSSGIAAPTGSAAPSGGFAMPSFKIPSDHGKMPYWMNWTELAHGPPSGPPSGPSGTAPIPSGTGAPSKPVASMSPAANSTQPGNSTAPIKTHVGFPTGAASSYPWNSSSSATAPVTKVISSAVTYSAPAEETVFVTVHDTVSVTMTTTVDAKPSSNIASRVYPKPTGKKEDSHGDKSKRGDATAPVKSGPQASSTTVAPGTPTDPDQDSACAELEKDGIPQNSHAPCHYHHATGSPMDGAAKSLGMLGGLVPRQSSEDDDAAPPSPQEQFLPSGVIPSEALAQAKMTGLPSTFVTSRMPAATDKSFHPKPGSHGALIL